MVDLTLSSLFRSMNYKLLQSKTGSIPDEDLGMSGMVFSPHFDDETLGCGGTIIRKIDRGADVSIVFMSDGTKSHSLWIPDDELSLLRKSEGIAAAKELGVEAKSVFILGFPESRLKDCFDQLRQEVNNLLILKKPRQVFLPYTGEPLMWSSDHVITTNIILDAIRNYPRDLTVYEYPIWAWFHYPWIRPQRGSLRQVLKNSIDYQFGFRLLMDFNFKVDIASVIDRKKTALKRHRSQMIELIPDVGWPTLENIAGGDFLRLFFQNYEYFRRN